ncbi:DUF4396 domain-containing protein [Actinomycetospora soli]|uniref:DUF4396 domain-containing protein n=1 Tax=Actinomycetospora soli TaxID=2893887 RepID=UPI001E5FF891|nr:DUF4396 domain-containing protein [Actinomycetospora soli]MCD2191538.1 DUF4396 domain-containing protein [Actinomycetospora soli]
MTMTMGANLPAWVGPLAWTYVVLSIVSAVIITVDIVVRGRGRTSRAMAVVWPITALYLGPFALPAYVRYGRATASATTGRDGTATLHLGLPGGAASVVAHLIGVPLVLVTGWTIAGLDMWAMIAVIAVLALGLLFLFEYTSRAAVGALGRGRNTLLRAGAVALATIVAFDLGMVGWMVVLHLGALMPPADDVSFVFLMQIGVVIGLATAFPLISALARRVNATAAH